MFHLPEDMDLHRLTGLHPFTALDLLTMVEIQQVHEVVLEVVGKDYFASILPPTLMFYDRMKRDHPDIVPLDLVVKVYAISRRRGEAEAFVMLAMGREWLATLSGPKEFAHG